MRMSSWAGVDSFQKQGGKKWDEWNEKAGKRRKYKAKFPFGRMHVAIQLLLEYPSQKNPNKRWFRVEGQVLDFQKNDFTENVPEKGDSFATVRDLTRDFEIDRLVTGFWFPLLQEILKDLKWRLRLQGGSGHSVTAGKVNNQPMCKV